VTAPAAENPGATSISLDVKRCTKRPAEVFEPELVQVLLDACPRHTSIGIRDRALIAMTFYAGLRVSESLALCEPELDLSTGRVHVLHGKRDKARYVWVPDAAINLTSRWLERKHSIGLGCPEIFPTLQGKRQQYPPVRRMLIRRAESAAIGSRVHWHALRHGFAAELADREVPVTAIMTALGHENLQVTTRYLSKIRPVSVMNAGRANPVVLT